MTPCACGRQGAREGVLLASRVLRRLRTCSGLRTCVTLLFVRQFSHRLAGVKEGRIEDAVGAHLLGLSADILTRYLRRPPGERSPGRRSGHGGEEAQSKSNARRRRQGGRDEERERKDGSRKGRRRLRRPGCSLAAMPRGNYEAFYDFSLPITSPPPPMHHLLNRAYLLSLAACCSVASCSSAADIAVTYTFVADKHISEVRLF